MAAGKYFAVSAVLSLFGSVLGQSSPIYTVEKNPLVFAEDLSTAPALAVGSHVVVVAGTHGLRMYSKSNGSLLDSELWAPGHPAIGYPFQPRHMPLIGETSSLVYPRAEYDPIADRLWMMFSEFGDSVGDHFEPGGGLCAPYLHLAVNRTEAGPLSSLSNTSWWYYTGASGVREAFNFSDQSMQQYPGGFHAPLEGNVMVPTLGFDDRAIFVTASDNGVCAVPELTSGVHPAIVVIPASTMAARSRSWPAIDRTRAT